MAAYDDLDVKRIFAVGVFSVVLTAVTALAVQVLYYAMVQWQDSETRAASNYTRQNQILEQQQAEISTYGVDEETGKIVIPIDKAIELLVSEKGTLHPKANPLHPKPVPPRASVTRPESTGLPIRYIIGFIVTFAVITASDRGRFAHSQGLQPNDGVILNDRVPREVENVTVEQKLGDRVPLNLPLTDSMGRRVKTGYFIDGKKPTIITLNYSNCPMLCNVQLNQLTRSLDELDLKIGEDFQILTVSIDPKETTETIRKTKENYVDQLTKGQPGAEEGWEFCTAQQPIITRLADVLGFQYTYDRKSGEYYHPAMLAFLSPEGVITRYSLAVAFEPSDLRKALIEAGDGTVGTPVDQIILWCFSYDPTSNSYVPQAWKIMRLAGLATICLMLACLAPYWIGRKRAPQSRSDDEPSELKPT